ncbi:MAG TPA: CARDB domain-containing protein [Candidatus Nanoarchaeia archaeon]|nr:CARDB domain-containing protein [Candidatus Nanoarchaeia archaeon]
MGWKIALSLLFFIIAVSLLITYWFIPINTTEFKIAAGYYGSNFENLTSESLQFYPNMRFPESKISYRVEMCSLQEQNYIDNAFDSLSSFTILSFYKVSSNEEISITCDETNKVEGGLLIAGEGGPVNITKAGDFNVIYNGKILLRRETSCPTPNVGIHELLHVLGFDHVNNPKSIMYPVSHCDQEIDDEIIDTLNELYSFPSVPDLTFENVSAIMRGKYLDVNLSVRNNGLKNSLRSNVNIFTDDKLVKELSIDSLEVGHGRVITVENVWVSRLTTDKIRFYIDYSFDEIKKENNEIVLEINR